MRQSLWSAKTTTTGDCVGHTSLNIPWTQTWLGLSQKSILMVWQRVVDYITLPRTSFSTVDLGISKGKPLMVKFIIIACWEALQRRTAISRSYSFSNGIARVMTPEHGGKFSNRKSLTWRKWALAMSGFLLPTKLWQRWVYNKRRIAQIFSGVGSLRSFDRKEGVMMRMIW